MKELAGDILAIPKHFFSFPKILLIAVFLLGGCASIRFSQVAPEGKDFHPQSIAVLDLDTGGHKHITEGLDRRVTAELKDTQWFQHVLSAQTIQSVLRKNKSLEKITSAYLDKLKAVNFSDSELSKKIAKGLNVDAFLLVDVEYWYYTTEAGNEVAKVGLGMKMIDANTGMVIWKAGHDLTRKYVFLKPKLIDIAGIVIGQMVRVMPH